MFKVVECCTVFTRQQRQKQKLFFEILQNSLKNKGQGL